MKLTLAGRKIDITNGIREHLQNMMDKTINKLGESADVHVALSIEKHRHYEKVTVKANGFTMYSQDEIDNLYTSLNNALLKIEKQQKSIKKNSRTLE